MWRVENYGVHGGITEPRLAAIGSRGCWPPLHRAEAQCNGAYHDAPWPDCECGFWALRSEGDARQTVNTYAHGDPMVVGRVNLWGRVLECERGWRAQYAYPAELVVIGDEKLTERLGELYGVPVKQMSKSDADALLYRHAQEYMRAIAGPAALTARQMAAYAKAMRGMAGGVHHSASSVMMHSASPPPPHPTGGSGHVGHVFRTPAQRLAAARPLPIPHLPAGSIGIGYEGPPRPSRFWTVWIAAMACFNLWGAYASSSKGEWLWVAACAFLAMANGVWALYRLDQHRSTQN